MFPKLFLFEAHAPPRYRVWHQVVSRGSVYFSNKFLLHFIGCLAAVQKYYSPPVGGIPKKTLETT